MAAFGAYLHIKAHAGISYLIHISKSLLASKPFLLHPKLPGAHRLPFHQLLFLITWLLLLCVLFPPLSQLALVTSSLLAMFSPLLFALDSSRCLWLFSHIYNQKLPLTYHVSLYSSTLGSQCLKSAQLHGGKDGIRFSCSQFPFSDFDDQKTKEHC